MKTRQKLSAALISLGLILAFLPSTGKRSLSLKPQKVLSEAINEENWLSPDKVAGLIVSEDSSIRLIDLRPVKEFRAFSIPGAINVPYNEFPARDPNTFLANGNIKNIFYSNGDTDSGYAIVMALGMKFKNVSAMRGGLNGWFETVMNSSFKGGRISPRENALFETRTRARAMFTEFNNLPDSLRMKSKKQVAKKLDGGCE